MDDVTSSYDITLVYDGPFPTELLAVEGCTILQHLPGLQVVYANVPSGVLTALSMVPGVRVARRRPVL